MARPRNLPPGAKWVTLTSGERRVQLQVMIGKDPSTGKRLWTKQRFRTVEEAADFYAETHSGVKDGTHVAKSGVTVEVACAEWLAGKRNLKTSTRSSYAKDLAPFRQVYGHLPVQKLTKTQLDDLVGKLIAGTVPLPMGKNGQTRPRREWSGRTVAMALDRLGQVLNDLIKQGRLTRNVAALVERPRHRREEADTWTDAEAQKFLAAVATDRMLIAWLLALYGVRRGEIAGLRWEHVDLDAKELTLGKVTRLAVDGAAVEDDGKSETSHRTLPMPTSMVPVFRELRRTQAAEKLSLGPAYTDSGFVVVDEAGVAWHPETISTQFQALSKAAGLPRIKLHEARHTGATLMHLAGEAIAVIAAWLGHSSGAFTQRTYVHSQPEALRTAADTLDRVYGR